MLRSLKMIERFTVSALLGRTVAERGFEHASADDDVGKVVDFLLDDERWVVRHLVVQTGGFFDGRQVLISPISFREIQWSSCQFHLALTKEQIKGSPSIDVDQPVSRQHERAYYGYYGYPYYWGYGVGLWGMGQYPGALRTGSWDAPLGRAEEAPSGDVHLRSARTVRGYHIQGSDAAIGHIDDFLFDDETWAVRYLVVDTSNWWVGKRVLVAPHWASQVSWEERRIYVDLTRQQIKDSPAWSEIAAIDRDYEARLHAHYGHPGYWVEDAAGPRSAQPMHDDQASHPG
ncbi:MAG: PRC-barrel domain-containing protein [Myxococcales bacterium]